MNKSDTQTETKITTKLIKKKSPPSFWSLVPPSCDSESPLGTSKLIGFAASEVLSTNSVCPVLLVCKSLSYIIKQ
jgi:hypothetical protein